MIALHGFLLEAASVEPACKHFGAALVKGYAGAKFRYSECLEKDDPARAATLLGDAPAQNNAGELYETGCGVKADPKLAIDWFRKAAQAGFVPAQFNLGRIYASGSGAPREFAEARKWLEKAERGGIAPARLVVDWMEKEKAD